MTLSRIAKNNQSNFCLIITLIVYHGFLFSVFSQTNLPASSIKTIYITPLSHYDFGFVEPPDQVRERAARHIDEVIRVAETNPNFKWTIESVGKSMNGSNGRKSRLPFSRKTKKKLPV